MSIIITRNIKLASVYGVLYRAIPGGYSYIGYARVGIFRYSPVTRDVIPKQLPSRSSHLVGDESFRAYNNAN